MDGLDNASVRRRSRLRLSLTVRRFDNLLCVDGDLDLATAPRLERVLERLETFGRPLCVDLATLQFADSAGWRTLEIAQQRRQQANRCSIRLVHLTGQPRRLVAVLDRIGSPEPVAGPRRRPSPHDQADGVT